MSFPNARRVRTIGPRRRGALGTLLVIVAVVFFLTTAGVALYTDGLWFRSIGFWSVWSRTLVTRAVLFAVFGLIAAALLVGNLLLAYRLRPIFRPVTQEQQALDEYRSALEPRRRLLFTVAGTLALLGGGAFGAGHWRTWMMWSNSQPFGTQDPQFHRDIGYFAFTYPFQRLLLGFAFAIVALALVGSAVLHYLYGGIRLQAPNGEHVGRSARTHLLVLLGVFALLKALAYWLDRYGLAFSERGFVTGPSYTDVTAMLPAKFMLMVIALLCALGIFVAAFIRGGVLRFLPGVSLGLLVVSAVLVGGIYPAVVQRFQVKPNEGTKEAEYIQRNIDATRVAYGIDKVEVVPATTDSATLPTTTDTNVKNVRLLDPNVVSATFRVRQQIRTYYSFQDLLDIDRYTIGGKQQETVVAVRELQQDKLPSTSWINQHIAYTHGIGVVAAAADTVTQPGGEPAYLEKDVPPTGTLPPFQPRIYIGETSPDYSIVGGSGNSEIDYLSDAAGADPNKITYAGAGGVPMGSPINRLAYALRLGDTNLLLSGQINADSKILYDRKPRDRVQAAAPWLQLDGDPYPAVVNGRVLWIVDGYTTSDGYPYSAKKQLGDVTVDANTGSNAISRETNEQVNYIRNSVKATVDAYDGTVKLYEWDETDPVLKVWEHAYPGTVTPKAELLKNPELVAHLRYPEDLFKVQRDVLARYHVTNPGTFYAKQNNWQVPTEPGAPAPVDGGPKPDQPPFFLMLQMPGQDRPTFSLTSALVPEGRSNLAAFVSASSDPGDYGKIRMIELPPNTTIAGPEQVRSTMDAAQQVSNGLLALKAGNSRVDYGNLLTVPVPSGLLYVQPYYTRATGASSFPILSKVGVLFGDQVGFGNTLAAALQNATATQTVTPGTTPPQTTGTPSGTTAQSTPPPPPTSTSPAPGVSPLPIPATLQDAVAALDKAVRDVDAATAAGDIPGYLAAEAHVRQARDALTKLVAALPATPAPSPAK